jgi:hypothetical protein
MACLHILSLTQLRESKMRTLFLIAILFTSMCFAETRTGREIPNQAVLPQGVRWQALSSNGVSYNFPTALSQISGSNPAALNKFDTLTMGLSYQFDTDVKEAYFGRIGYKDNYLYLPQSLALAYPLNNGFSVGVAFAQKYNAGFDLGNLPVTTSSHPEGTGESFSPDIRTNIYSLSAIIAMDLKKSVPGLSLALRYNYDRINYSDKVDQFESSASGASSSFAAGFAYQINAGFGVIEVAGFYEHGADWVGTLKSNFSSRGAIDTTDGRIHYGDPLTPTKAGAVLPNRWHLGLNAETDIGQFMFEFASIDWEPTGNFKEAKEFSASFTRPVSEETAISLGMFSTDKKIGGDLPKSWDKFTALFITVGIKTKFKGFDVDLALADSHFSSDKWREQTVFKIAVSTSL